jgi:uncharacterized membrane protein
MRALFRLALVGASLGLFACQRPGLAWTAVWQKNTLAMGERRLVGFCMAVAIALLWAGAAIWYRRRGTGPESFAAIDRVARILSPLILLGLLPGVASAKAWPDPLQSSLVLAAFVLALEPLVRTSLTALSDGARPAWLERLARPSPRVRRWAPVVVVAVAMLAYAAYMIHFALLNHHRFNTAGYDLGIYDNQFWQALHGHPFRSSPVLRHEGDWSVLKTHAEFAMYALLPFYALAPGPEVLLVLQTLLLAAGAVPIYRFAGRRSSKAIAAVLALSYLAYPPLHGANLYDFHFQPIGAVFVLYAIDFLDEKRWLPFAFVFALALTCREDISILLLVYGTFLVANDEQPRSGALIAAIAALYFVVVKFVVMPHFGQWWFADMYKDLFPPDNHSYGGILETLLLNPVYVLRTLLTGDKLRYALQIFVPLAFLPLRRPRLWWLALPGFFFTLLSTGYPATIDCAFQYSAYWFALLFPATALALASFGPDPAAVIARRSACVALVVGSLLMTARFGAIPPRATFRAGFGDVHFTPLTAADRQKEPDVAELVALVPLDASLAVSDYELPHVSKRSECYSLKDGAADSDYILYAVGSAGSQPGAEELRLGKMVLQASRGNLRLLRRKTVPAPAPVPRPPNPS